MMYVRMYVSVNVTNSHARTQLGQPRQRCIDLARGPHCACIFLVHTIIHLPIFHSLKHPVSVAGIATRHLQIH